MDNCSRKGLTCKEMHKHVPERGQNVSSMNSQHPIQKHDKARCWLISFRLVKKWSNFMLGHYKVRSSSALVRTKIAQ